MRIWDSIRLLLSLGGIGVGIYLTLLHFNTHIALVCSTNSVVNCEQVLASPQSRIFGIPWAVLGMLWFIVEAGLSIQSLSHSGNEPDWLRWGSLAWVMVGIATVVYLLYLELGVIKYICLWCTSTHVLVAVLFIIQIVTVPWRIPPDNTEEDAAIDRTT